MCVRIIVHNCRTQQYSTKILIIFLLNLHADNLAAQMLSNGRKEGGFINVAVALYKFR